MVEPTPLKNTELVWISQIGSSSPIWEIVVNSCSSHHQPDMMFQSLQVLGIPHCPLPRPTCAALAKISSTRAEVTVLRAGAWASWWVERLQRWRKLIGKLKVQIQSKFKFQVIQVKKFGSIWINWHFWHLWPLKLSSQFSGVFTSTHTFQKMFGNIKFYFGLVPPY